MVRFIIGNKSKTMFIASADLHSNMVRFIMPKKNKASKSLFKFTFQYG